jgi:hypothetical protein
MQNPKNERTVTVLTQDGIKHQHSVDAFEQRTSLSYLSHLEFATEKLREEVRRRCTAAVALGKVSIRAGLLGKHYREEIESGYVNDVYIKWTGEKAGLGLFAGRHIGEGEFIGEYTGIVRKCWLYFSDSNDYCFRYPLYHIGPLVYVIDATRCCNQTSFINHSETPNCDTVVVLHEEVFHICVRAIRAIAKDQEITFDYGAKRHYE